MLILPMPDLDALFARLRRSPFRRRFRLGEADAWYLQKKGLPTILEHAQAFVRQRLAPARPPKDGKQTPYGGHPVFVAQHATATCCRACLQKWHGIPRGHTLTKAEVSYILAVLEHWLAWQSRLKVSAGARSSA